MYHYRNHGGKDAVQINEIKV